MLNVAANMQASSKCSTDQQFVDDMLAVASCRDKAAFTRLFDHFAPLLRRFNLAAYPGASLMADELTQEVMIKVWRKAHTYQPQSAAVSTWIFTLARNARIDYLRKNSRHQSDIDPEFIWTEIPDENADPFVSAQQVRNQEVIKQGLTTLPVDQQQVLVKVYMESKSHAEVAIELNLPLGTVKSRVRLALNKLAVTLKR